LDERQDSYETQADANDCQDNRRAIIKPHLHRRSGFRTDDDDDESPLFCTAASVEHVWWMVL
jgi:hypothetical protein